MQTIIKKPLLAFLLLAFGLSLASFSDRKGGDSFAIFLNDKLVLEQFMYKDRTVKSLVLTDANYNDKLSIRFSHCGKSGTERSISLIDPQDRVVKKWTFANSSNPNSAMSCSVKEIMDLQKTKGNFALRLFYASEEMPKGHVLLSVAKRNTSVASR